MEDRREIWSGEVGTNLGHKPVAVRVVQGTDGSMWAEESQRSTDPFEWNPIRNDETRSHALLAALEHFLANPEPGVLDPPEWRVLWSGETSRGSARVLSCEDAIRYERRDDHDGVWREVDDPSLIETASKALLDLSKKESKARIEVGSVVMLKSGGPEMTVMEVMGQSIKVSWFLKDNTTMNTIFSLAGLKKLYKP